MISKACAQIIDHSKPLESPLMIAERTPAFNRLPTAARDLLNLREILKPIRERLAT